MNAKTLIILGIVTAAVVAFATLSKSSGGTAQGAEIGEPLFAGLLSKVNDVARVEVERGGERVTAVKRGDAWALENVGGYPAKFETVKKGLMAIAELKVSARKTKDPTRHAEIGVADPSDDNEAATRVTLSDAKGAKVADVILGDTKSGRSPQVFVRVPGDPQAWLVDGRVNLSSDAKSWMERQILNIGADRVASVLVAHQDGERLSVYKTAATDPNYTVDNIPEGKQLIAPSTPNSLGSALSYLSLDDVRPVGDVDFDTSPGATAEFRTWDGLVVTSFMTEDEGTQWVRFEVRYEAPPTPVVEGDDADEEGAAVDTADAERAAQDEATKLSQALAPWAFTFPSYKQSNFDKRIEALVRDPDPATPDAADEDPTAPFDAFSIDDALQGLDVPMDVDEHDHEHDHEHDGEDDAIEDAGSPHDEEDGHGHDHDHDGGGGGGGR